MQASLITRDQLQIALHEQRRTGDMLGAILVRLGFLDESALATILAERTGFDPIDLKKMPIDAGLLQKLPRAVALRCRVVPMNYDGHTLEVAMADPYDVAAMDEIRRYFQPVTNIVPLIALATDIAEVIEYYSDSGVSIDDILHELELGGARSLAVSDTWEHPIVRLVNTILSDGVRHGASDIHFEPEGNCARLRYRIDGVMQQVRILHRTHWPELSHRLKIMAGMNIADTRSLQDGRFDMVVGGTKVDFRVAVMPTSQGENIVIRILDHRRALLPLEKLGFGTHSLTQLDRILERPEGIILVTGPTGSGKTTTLYSMLTKISSIDVNVMTLEEPIEYRLDLIRQTSVREGQGLGFAEGVRGILRQDPDIVFIGEARDGDIAQMALRAAITGHKVFSTLHCNDALGALPRLIDLGLRPRMLAGHVGGVVAQRLVRKLCPQCRTMHPMTQDEARLIQSIVMRAPVEAAQPVTGFAEAQSQYIAPVAQKLLVGRPVGCEYCHGTGYRGRIAIAEILRVTPELDELIAADVPRSAMHKQMRAEGFQSMAEDGVGKVLRGEVSLDSLRRAVDLTRVA